MHFIDVKYGRAYKTTKEFECVICLLLFCKGVLCDLKVTGSSHGIGHWKQVRPPTIHPLGCGPSPDPAYAGCFVHRAAIFK